MKPTLTIIAFILAGYLIARFFPGPGNALGLPKA